MALKFSLFPSNTHRRLHFLVVWNFSSFFGYCVYWIAAKEELKNANIVNAKPLAKDDGRKKHEALQTQVEQLQTEIMNVQIKYQKELEKLEKENRELRQQYLIMKTNRKVSFGKKIKVSLKFWAESYKFPRKTSKFWKNHPFFFGKTAIFWKNCQILQKTLI